MNSWGRATPRTARTRERPAPPTLEVPGRQRAAGTKPRVQVAPGGFTPHHSHPYEHEVFVLEGQGTILDGAVERPLQAGDVVYVAPGDVHQFRNGGNAPLKFLCLVPNSASKLSATMCAPRSSGAVKPSCR